MWLDICGHCRFHYFVAKISVFSVHFGPLDRDFGCSGVGFAQQIRRYRSGHDCIRVESQLRAPGEIAEEVSRSVLGQAGVFNT
jgi:hypothetical protein